MQCPFFVVALVCVPVACAAIRGRMERVFAKWSEKLRGVIVSVASAVPVSAACGGIPVYQLSYLSPVTKGLLVCNQKSSVLPFTDTERQVTPLQSARRRVGGGKKEKAVIAENALSHNNW